MIKYSLSCQNTLLVYVYSVGVLFPGFNWPTFLIFKCYLIFTSDYYYTPLSNEKFGSYSSLLHSVSLSESYVVDWVFNM